MEQYDTVYLYISTFFFILLTYVYKIVMMEPFTSSEVLTLGLLYFAWYYLSKYITGQLTNTRYTAFE